MSSSKSSVEALVDALGPEARTRAMMGEYVLYWRERVVGGVYDDRLLLKDVPATRQAHPDAPLEEPYPGARAMRHLDLPRDETEAQELIEVLEEMWEQVPAPRPRKR